MVKFRRIVSHSSKKVALAQRNAQCYQLNIQQIIFMTKKFMDIDQTIKSCGFSVTKTIIHFNPYYKMVRCQYYLYLRPGLRTGERARKHSLLMKHAIFFLEVKSQLYCDKS